LTDLYNDSSLKQQYAGRKINPFRHTVQSRGEINEKNLLNTIYHVFVY